MESKKRPSDIELEELLNLAGSSEIQVTKDQIFALSNDVPYFLNTFKIKTGRERISTKALFKVYKKWSKEPLTHATFKRRVKSYIPVENDYFKINLNVIEFESTVLEILKEKKVLKTKSKDYKENFDNFKSFYGIKEGQYWIEYFMLYYLYDKWTYEKKHKNVMTKEQLKSFFKMFFVCKKVKNEDWIRVSLDILDHLPVPKQHSLREAKQKYHDKEEKNPTKFR